MCYDPALHSVDVEEVETGEADLLVTDIDKADFNEESSSGKFCSDHVTPTIILHAYGR